MFSLNFGVPRLNCRAHLGLDLLPSAADALFNSYDKRHLPTCLSDTRVDLLQQIYSWADGQDDQCIFWLNGLAGTGKSTIARTVARKYFDQKRLGASFFFSRGGGDTGHARKFFTSLAVQLARNVPQIQRFISDAVIKQNNIANQSLRDQWRQLVLRPLSRLDRSSYSLSYMLVVDALDECDSEGDSEGDSRMILQLLTEARVLKTTRLRVFLTSRPEIPIRHGFYQIPDSKRQDFILHNISPLIVNQDISTFLQYNLNFIAAERSLGASWPGEQIIKRLVQNASGLFIWAATACRFIREGKRFAAKRLDMILENNSTVIHAAEKHLSEIYLTVLRHSISPDYTTEEAQEQRYKLKCLLGSIVTLFSPLSTQSLSKLINTSQEEVGQTLDDLHAILDIPRDQTCPIRLHHPSFRDFLLSKERCGDSNFQVDEKQAHQTLANCCIQLMFTSLKQNVCEQEAPGTLVGNVESSQLEQCLPPEVQYACIYWVQHFEKSCTQLQDNDIVHQFLKLHLLHWLEALCWMRRLSEGIHAINLLESISLAKECSTLQIFIQDMKRFALFCRVGIENAPLQIYCSALIFAPGRSIVKNHFRNQIPRWIGKLPEVEEHWNALLQTLQGHSGRVNAVAFSVDGNLLASASRDKSVRIWNPATGKEMQRLERHSGEANAVAFSCDGSLLASGSSDGTVRLWNPGTGEEVQILEGHTGKVNAVAFSCDGSLLASGSSDKTPPPYNSELIASASWDRAVIIWNSVTGEKAQQLEGHSGRITSVAFSYHCPLLAAAEWDCAVTLWNLATGEEVRRLKHRCSVSAVAFSRNGQLLASADTRVRLWNPATGEEVLQLEVYSRAVAVAFSPDSQVLASAGSTVQLWNLPTGEELQQPIPVIEKYVIYDIAFSHDGKLLASASEDGTVRLWNPATGEQVKQLLDGTSVFAIAFSRDGKLLASASDDGVTLWNPSTGRMVQQLVENDWFDATVFSHDGQLLASASTRGMITLWNSVTGQEVQQLNGHDNFITAMAFSCDNQLLASGSKDRTVRLWNLATGEELQRFQLNTTISQLCISSNGQRLETDKGALLVLYSLMMSG
ncbi:hypothetical protein DL95DRAFT_472452 [Leptodontidium sp. 2 PMI_412]|nr:hypothetical protein DL95DRAFT_472452 [Leptodontidium sp. 2 PMI_412]